MDVCNVLFGHRSGYIGTRRMHTHPWLTDPRAATVDRSFIRFISSRPVVVIVVSVMDWLPYYIMPAVVIIIVWREYKQYRKSYLCVRFADIVRTREKRIIVHSLRGVKNTVVFPKPVNETPRRAAHSVRILCVSTIIFLFGARI